MNMRLDKDGVFRLVSDAGGSQPLSRRECVMLLSAIRHMANVAWKRGEIVGYNEWDTLRNKINVVRATDPVLGRRGDEDDR